MYECMYECIYIALSQDGARATQAVPADNRRVGASAGTLPVSGSLLSAADGAGRRALQRDPAPLPLRTASGCRLRVRVAIPLCFQRERIFAT